MQIVIDIPEDVYKRTVFYREFKELNDCITTIKALENCVPLPEHHGRLIDAEELSYNAETCIETTDAFINLINKAPTLIEAEEGE